jgi:phosphoribosyl 1,2-cyclic phosphodiesterase
MPNTPESSPRNPALQVRFWGVRGSIPTPLAANLGHGGNTSCVQILDPSDPAITFIFDAGTGIHTLGPSLVHDAVHNIHLFLTHFHWDHIQGLPGFVPLFVPHNTLTFYSSHGRHELRRVLQAQMAAPYFPVEFDHLTSTRHFEHLERTTTINGLTIEPFALHHPGGATGFRISRGNSTIVYATDHEHGNPAADARLLAAATNADILIYDAQYTPEVYPHRIGWGHSTWLEATKLANAANVQQLVLFHHDPHHSDAALEAIVAQARQHFPNTTAATEGTTLTA